MRPLLLSGTARHVSSLLLSLHEQSPPDLPGRSSKRERGIRRSPLTPLGTRLWRPGGMRSRGVWGDSPREQRRQAVDAAEGEAGPVRRPSPPPGPAEVAGRARQGTPPQDQRSLRREAPPAPRLSARRARRPDIRLTSGKGLADLTVPLSTLIDTVVKQNKARRRSLRFLSFPCHGSPPPPTARRLAPSPASASGLTGCPPAAATPPNPCCLQVVAFIKGARTAPECGFSQRLVGILTETGVDFEVVNVLDTVRERGSRGGGGVLSRALLGLLRLCCRVWRPVAPQPTARGAKCDNRARGVRRCTTLASGTPSRSTASGPPSRRRARRSQSSFPPAGQSAVKTSPRRQRHPPMVGGARSAAGVPGCCLCPVGERTAPDLPAQLYIKGEFIGGSDIVADLHEKGELAAKLGVKPPAQPAGAK